MLQRFTRVEVLCTSVFRLDDDDVDYARKPALIGPR
jgi:hypothetical protein